MFEVVTWEMKHSVWRYWVNFRKEQSFSFFLKQTATVDSMLSMYDSMDEYQTSLFLLHGPLNDILIW